jgi:serine phosphatase RsbU (regulator of sigma subunit)
VTEGRANGEEFGLARVEAALMQAAITSAEQLCGDILDAAEQFTKEPHAENDVTALALLRAAVAKAAGPSQ